MCHLEFGSGKEVKERHTSHKAVGDALGLGHGDGVGAGGLGHAPGAGGKGAGAVTEHCV